MNYKINIELKLDENHLRLIKELYNNSSTISVLENKKGFAFTWIADLCHEGIAARNDIGQVWLTQFGKQIYNKIIKDNI